ncbi:sulfatase [Myxococcota bacterium]|nr:sulfatase [Myxococcota bacterium]
MSFWSRVCVREVASLACAFAVLACSAPKQDRAPNFIVVMVDTLRLDHLGFAGSEVSTPGFDRLAERGTWFVNAYSTSPWTLPSVASLFVSEMPSQHQVMHWGSHLGAGASTLAGALSTAGYQTAAWSASRLIVPARGILQGFSDRTLVRHPGHTKLGGELPIWSEKRVAPASAVIPQAMDWIRRHVRKPEASPFFVYLHLMEPHTPYLCPETAEPDCVARARMLTGKLYRKNFGLDAEESALTRRLYAADVMEVDRALSKMLDTLKDARVLDSTWIVLVSDHGEFLGEGGRYLHGTALSELMVHVPLLLSGPNGQPREDLNPVSIIDVAPTLLQLAGVKPPESWRGRSLVPALRGEDLSARPAVAELFLPDSWSQHRLAVVHGREKWILELNGSVSRFELEDDPGEEKPHPSDLEELRELLRTVGVHMDLTLPDDMDAPEITQEDREQLEALGYMY